MSISPAPPVARIATTDIVEINHFYSWETGRHLFDQFIWYDWATVTYTTKADPLNPNSPDIEVKQYRPQVRDCRHGPSAREITIARDVATGLYVARWSGSEGSVCVVKSRSFRESWTQYDPETEERDLLPVNKRRLLFLPIPRSLTPAQKIE